VYTPDVWKKGVGADYDPAAQVALESNDASAARDLPGKPAAVTVLLLPAPPGGLKTAAGAAKAYLAQQTRMVDKAAPDPEPVKDRTGADQEKDLTINEIPGHVSKLRVRGPEKRDRYVVLWVVPVGDFMLVVKCECDWERRQFWDTEFRDVVEAFTKKKPK